MDIINEVYSIKEVSEITGFKPHVIRYYDKEFELNIPRNESNRRYFTYKELEKLRYIKTLQTKGLTNTQVKQVLKSPEVILNEGDQTSSTQETAVAVANSEKQLSFTNTENDSLYNLLNQIFINIQQLDYRREFQELYEKIEEFQNQIINQENDVLVCEIAKLKLKMKEKSYEVAELKEKLKREQNKKVTFFSKIFGGKQ